MTREGRTASTHDERGFRLPPGWAEAPCAKVDYRQRGNVFACPEKGCALTMTCLFQPEAKP